MIEADERRCELTIERLAVDAAGLTKLEVPTKRTSVSLLGYGWWVRCVRTADAIRVLHRSGVGHEASPLVRTLLHHTAALNWLRREPNEALEAVRYSHKHHANKAATRMLALAWSLTDVDYPDRPDPASAPEGVALLRNTAQLAERVGMQHIYIAYMLESDYVHPSAIGADAYLTMNDGDVQLRPEASVPPVRLRVSAMSVIQATLCLAELTGDARIRALADDATDRFGLEVHSAVVNTRERDAAQRFVGLLAQTMQSTSRSRRRLHRVLRIARREPERANTRRSAVSTRLASTATTYSSRSATGSRWPWTLVRSTPNRPRSRSSRLAWRQRPRDPSGIGTPFRLTGWPAPFGAVDGRARPSCWQPGVAVHLNR